MRERPILMNGAMVRAVLNGSKTQTRRIVKPQPMESDGQTYGGKIFGPEMYEPAAYDKHGDMVPGPEIFGIYNEDGDWGVKCPFGQPGDRLWVREAIRLAPDQEPDDGTGRVLSTYAADSSPTPADAWPWKRNYLPPMHCPRGLSRIDLEITAVRVERLQDISEADAKAEGLDSVPSLAYPKERSWCDYRIPHDSFEWFRSPIDSYRSLWESINGYGSWDANPWVWVIEFKPVGEE